MNPVSIRLTQEDMAIIQRIIEDSQKPGLKINLTDAIKIALASWAITHPA